MSVALLGVLTGALAAQTPGTSPTAARHLMVDGARIYYEVHGAGRPVILLHGGLFGSIDEFARIIPTLARNHRVIAIGLRGHGRSEMGTEPLSNRRFAQDAAAIIRHEARDSADVIGFSTGAMAAYILASDYPALVRSLVAIGGPIAASGSTDAGREEMKAYATPERVEQLYPRFVAERRRLYADPRDWDRLVREFAAIAEHPDISEASIRSIAIPALIIAGDRDHYTKTEHFVHIARLLPQGSLAIVPACGHVVLACRPELMGELIEGFLREPRTAGAGSAIGAP